MTLEEIFGKVAEDTGLTKDFVGKVYKAYWKAIREHITSLPLKEDLTDEEFSNLQPNVNIPSIGKLYITPERYRRMKDNYKKYEQLKKENNDSHKED